MSTHLSNFIGIRYLVEAGQATAPTSGYYIDDYPGVDVTKAGKAADERYQSGIEMLQRVITAETSSFADEIWVDVQKDIRLLPTVQVERTGEFKVGSYLTTENLNKGLEICIEGNEPMSKIYIPFLDLLTNTTTTDKTIEIVDGEKVYSYSADLTAGESTRVEIDREFEMPRVWVRWNTSDIAVNDSGYGRGNCSSCGTVWKGKYTYSQNGVASVTGRTANGRGTSKTYGILATFQVRCSRDTLIYALRRELRTIVLYRCLMGFAKHVVASDRLNPFTTHNKDWYNDMLSPDYAESWIRKYQRALKAFMTNSQRAIKQYAGSCADCKTPRKAVVTP